MPSSSTTQPHTASARKADIRLLVLDIDGTIAGESNAVRAPVLQAVQAVQARGIPVAIATGRMYRSALRFHQAVGSTLPLIAYQGALVKDPATNRVHRHWPVARHQAIALLDAFEQPHLRDQLSVHFYINDTLYIREESPDSRDYSDRSGIEAVAVGDLRLALSVEPTKVLAMSSDSALIQTLLTQMRAHYPPSQLYFTTSTANFLEAAHPAVNKGAAVKFLAEECLGLQPENVMVVGDNFNDLEMIEYAGIGVAMGDAPAGVKAVANWVAPNVENDGAAAAIEQFILSA